MLVSSDLRRRASVSRSQPTFAGKETVEARQLTPEKGMPPLKQVKATDRSAHVDQDEDYDRVICKRAAGQAEPFGVHPFFLG